ncbi:MAG TPA: bifunctional 4-hydroxy-2-oxoglutarate aldolase/2-dehydro-3-deoxy-phosphogluconate aldolase [Armatimonadota bacterium]|jgi:2-dehydro-3-deoxyphosphogluconate aldolase/(4S)-4-hydroxy-2-oxoglutarate aldolase|nr:bifunctional 4-hydroxy-2-oxoglutarate aldolase/2-dehydro-3-deoxy-phosphogluconate aldolase [Armatimonadota bacterium]
MRERNEVVAQIRNLGVVAIVRADTGDEALAAARAVREGGLRAIEVTFTVPGAAEIIRRLAEEMGEEILLGAGTVLTADQAREAVAAGAEYLIAPDTDPEVIAEAHRLGRPIFPGAFSPSEVARAWKLGADLIKLFPAARLGPAYLKDLRGPFPQIPLVPVGGVDASNCADYFRNGAVAIGVGGKLVDRALLREGRYDEITRRARELAATVQVARQSG